MRVPATYSGHLRRDLDRERQRASPSISQSAVPNRLRAVSGSGQTGLINTQLDEPFIVRLEDQFENPIPGETVSFAITQVPPQSTGYSLSVTSAETDGNGEVSTFLTLGNLPGTHQVNATYQTLTPASFTASTGDAWSVSGTVTQGGTGLSSVSVAVAWDQFSQSATTNQNGVFVVSGIPNGATNVTITPSRDGYLFSPEQVVIEGPVTNHVTDIDFITVPPFAPELIAPANDTTGLSRDVTLRWAQTERTTHYRLQVARNNNFTGGMDVDVDDIPASTTTFDLDSLEYGQTYYWRVNAKNPSGASDWSATRNFTIIPTEIHAISLRAGWNMVSSYNDPLDTSFAAIMESVIDNLIFAKDGGGKVFIPHPDFNINEIGRWDPTKAYQIYLDPAADTLEVFGTAMYPESMPIHLSANSWAMIGYLRNSPLNAAFALESIADNLIIAKDGDGLVYIPPGVIEDEPINTMGNMQPGYGYKIFTSGESQLIYPGNNFSAPQNESQKMLARADGYKSLGQNARYLINEFTDNNAVIILKSPDLSIGDEIGVRTGGGLLVGGGFVVNDGIAVATVWGDDGRRSDRISGAVPDEPLTLTLWSQEEKKEKDIEVLTTTDLLTGNSSGNQIRYNRDAVIVAAIEIVEDIPETFLLLQNYPNPFNATTTISYGLPQDSRVVLDVYNILGQRIAKIVDEDQSAGSYEIIFDASLLSSGTYFYRLQAGDFVGTKRFILLK
jgi:hypothetical protein